MAPSYSSFLSRGPDPTRQKPPVLADVTSPSQPLRHRTNLFLKLTPFPKKKKQKSPHPTTAVPTGRGVPSLKGGVENKAGGALSMSKQPQVLWVPPWGWVLSAAVFHQILRKDPWGRSHWPGHSHLPTLWPHSQSCPRPVPGWVGTSPPHVGSTLLLRVQRRLWGCLARDDTVLSHHPDVQGEAAGS